MMGQGLNANKVNLSAPRPEGRGLLKVHPEPRLLTPPLKAGLRAVERVKVMVGGAPLTEKFAKEIGADGYAPDAASAVQMARSLIS